MDSFFGIGLAELFFIAVIALVVLGPERLPATLREVAKAWGYIRNLGRELTSQFSEEFKALEDLNPRKLLNELADEEMKKDLKALTQKPSISTTTKPATTKPTTPKPATPKSATATTKPASTTAKPTTNTMTTKSVAKAKPAEKAAATPSTTEGATAATGPQVEQGATEGAENSILPPPPTAAAANESSGEGPAEESSVERTPLTSTAAVSVNGASSNGATDTGENTG